MSEKKISVLIIYTGGTIGMIQDPETGALMPFNFDHLLDNVRVEAFGFLISSIQFEPPIDSSEIDPASWIRLVKIIADNYDTYDGFCRSARN